MRKAFSLPSLEWNKLKIEELDNTLTTVSPPPGRTHELTTECLLHTEPCGHNRATKLRSPKPLKGNLVRATYSKENPDTQEIQRGRNDDSAIAKLGVRENWPYIKSRAIASILSLNRFKCWVHSDKSQAGVSIPGDRPEQQTRSERGRTSGPEQVKWITGNPRF